MAHKENRTVTANSGGGDIPVWTTESGEGDRPGVLIVPAIFGVDEGSKTLARDLASAGAHVWIVDPFWRTSPGVIAPRDEEGFAKAMARARKVDEELARLWSSAYALRANFRCCSRARATRPPEPAFTALA